MRGLYGPYKQYDFLEHLVLLPTKNYDPLILKKELPHGSYKEPAVAAATATSNIDFLCWWSLAYLDINRLRHNQPCVLLLRAAMQHVLQVVAQPELVLLDICALFVVVIPT